MNGIFVRWLILTIAIIVTSYLLDGIQAVFGSLFISLISWFITSFINERGTVQYIDLRHKGNNRWE